MTLSEIYDSLMEEDADDDETVAIKPPYEEPNAMTDCDSDNSDDEVSCNPDHLPKRILQSNILDNAVEISKDAAQPSTSGGPAPKKCKKEKFNWHHDATKVANIIGDYKVELAENISPNLSTNPLEFIA